MLHLRWVVALAVVDALVGPGVAVPRRLEARGRRFVGPRSVGVAAASSFRQEWWSGASSRSDPLAALDEACLGLEEVLGCAAGEHVLTFCFLTRGFIDAVPSVSRALEVKLGGHAHTAVTVVGGGVIAGVGDEREDGVASEEKMVTELAEGAAPGVSILCGVLPRGSGVTSRAFGMGRAPPPKKDREAWRAAFGADDDYNPVRGFFLFADPQSRWLQRSFKALDAHFPAALKVGGLSAPLDEERPSLALNGEAVDFGTCLALALQGPRVRLDAIVSQGCAAVGETYTVTAVEQGQVLVELDDAPAFSAVETTGQAATDREKMLMESQLLVGLRPAVADRESKAKAARGRQQGTGAADDLDDEEEEEVDWLVRQVIGLVPTVNRRLDWSYRLTAIDMRAGNDKPGLAIGAEVQPGDMLRFHVRDAQAADDDLKLQFRRYAVERQFAGGAKTVGKPRAAVMFQCIGRGSGMFGKTGHDSAAFGDEFGDFVALGGFFANGEIGPLGAITGGAQKVDPARRETHQHEYTTVVALISSLDDVADGDDDGDKAAAVAPAA